MAENNKALRYRLRFAVFGGSVVLCTLNETRSATNDWPHRPPAFRWTCLNVFLSDLTVVVFISRCDRADVAGLALKNSHQRLQGLGNFQRRMTLIFTTAIVASRRPWMSSAEHSVRLISGCLKTWHMSKPATKAAYVFSCHG